MAVVGVAMAGVYSEPGSRLGGLRQAAFALYIGFPMGICWLFSGLLGSIQVECCQLMHLLRSPAECL